MIRRTLALVGATALAVGFTGLAGPASADTGVNAQVGDVVIQEVGLELSTIAVQDTFIELHNISDDPVDISRWELRGCNTTSGDFLIAGIPLGTAQIPAGGKFLVATSAYSGPVARDLLFESSASLELGGGGVELLDINDSPMGDVKWESTHSACSTFEPANQTPTDVKSLDYVESTGSWSLADPMPENTTS